MVQIRRFTVQPRLPERLAALERLANNLWWSWNTDAIALFRWLDQDLFTASNHNPVQMLGVVGQQRLDELAADGGFLANLGAVAERFDRYMREDAWFAKTHGDAAGRQVVYFSAEFGLHESLPIYSGGLGVLAGDHMKSASELGLPLAGMGLLYQQGYFRQYLNAEGWQQERYPENDFFNLPCQLQKSDDGNPLTVSIDFPGRQVHAQVWRIQVGRTPLYMLDTNFGANSAEDRQITAQLYGGDNEHRVKQEMVLGVGGLRAAYALGLDPAVCHMNEGHSAFLALERIRTTMSGRGVDFATARQLVSAGSVFTTHTPVPAGNDMFPPALVEKYLGWHMDEMGIGPDSLLPLGRINPEDPNEPFCMTVLALRLANHANGVSKLHGAVSRKMWQGIWPNLPVADVPIGSVTNGVHYKGMLCAEMKELYDRYLGPDWSERPTDHDVWQKVATIPDHELWKRHEQRRSRLVAFARRRLVSQMTQRGAGAAELHAAEEVLDPDALTIGFARRFATYKRGDLVFRDLERLKRIVNSADRPVQFVFAGKAHPKDHGGKELIARIANIAKQPELRRRVVFIEDYDINVARTMVQGVDVWLNNPRRPLEASGTSGMKGPFNGGINLSVLDGWWCEGYSGDNGWAIGSGEEYRDLTYQDDVESRAIYQLLEEEVVPLFYSRDANGIPTGWVQRMKRSIMTVAPVFNTNRMVQQYAEKFYLPAAARHAELSASDAAGGKTLADWLGRVSGRWDGVKVENVTTETNGHVQVGGDYRVTAEIDLGELTSDDVRVDLYYGHVDAGGQIAAARTAPMTFSSNGDGRHRFVGAIPCTDSGQHGFAVRVLPNHDHLPRTFEPGLIHWS